MEIDEMVAGPELDRLVAEEVMGWHLALGDWNSELLRRSQVWLNESGAYMREAENSGIGGRPFKPSTDISAAWEVVERFRQHGGQPLVYWDADKQRWLAGMGDDFLSDTWSAWTAPLAICRAALKARRAAKKLEAETPSNEELHKPADKYLPTQDSCDEEWEGD